MDRRTQLKIILVRITFSFPFTIKTVRRRVRKNESMYVVLFTFSSAITDGLKIWFSPMISARLQICLSLMHSFINWYCYCSLWNIWSIFGIFNGKVFYFRPPWSSPIFTSRTSNWDLIKKDSTAILFDGQPLPCIICI